MSHLTHPAHWSTGGWRNPTKPLPTSIWEGSFVMRSRLKRLGPVKFPKFTGEKVYMEPFDQNGLPPKLKRWLPTVQAMCNGLTLGRESYIMIDQSEVKAGTSHRRSGPHIDGNWIPGNPGSGVVVGKSGTGHVTWNEPKWNSEEALKTEAIVLASDVIGCIAYVGDVTGIPMEGGDCSHLELSGLRKVILEPNVAYIGNVFMIHESVPVSEDCQRTLVRLNLPGVTFK